MPPVRIPVVAVSDVLGAPVFHGNNSESEADDADLRFRAQEDASVLYARPAIRAKTRTFSEVRFDAVEERKKS